MSSLFFLMAALIGMTFIAFGVIMTITGDLQVQISVIILESPSLGVDGILKKEDTFESPWLGFCPEFCILLQCFFFCRQNYTVIRLPQFLKKKFRNFNLPR